MGHTDHSQHQTSFCRKLFIGKHKSITDYERELTKEIAAYEKSTKFQNKIDEVLELKGVNWKTGRVGEVASFLEQIISQGSSVLDLGSAAGLFARKAKELTGSSGRVVGVELVPGWVSASRENVQGVEFIQGDITMVHLKERFDVIFLADVYEHIPKYRLQNLWKVIENHSKTGTLLYIHVPNEEKQRKEIKIGQYFEMVVESKDLKNMATCFGFSTQKILNHRSYSSYLFKKTLLNKI